ncbi:MAG: hypothetical protein DRP18_05455, partial [Candidatus Aenigmatarchaeota archaeon]
MNYPSGNCVDSYLDCVWDGCEKDCGAGCESNADCSDKCEGDIRYYNGVCNSDECSCVYTTETCSDTYAGKWCDANSGDIYNWYNDIKCVEGCGTATCEDTGNDIKDGIVEDCEDTCTDTDGGHDYFVKGTVTDEDECSGTQSNCPSAEYTDFCTANILTEYFCTGNDYDSEQKDCDDYDCSTPSPLNCVGVGTDTIKETGDDYGCSNGACEVVGTKDCNGPWICDDNSECNAQDCGGSSYKCYYDGGFKWGIPPTTETDCADGHDNDCDGLTDCADSDCVGQTGPNGNLCCQDSDDCESFGALYYYPEIATCNYDPDNFGCTFDYRQKYPGMCNTGINECQPRTPGSISHICADSDPGDGGPKIPSGNGIRTCSAECDGFGTECQPYVDGDYCYYGGSCNTDPQVCACDYASEEYCPEPGTIDDDGFCYYGDRTCTEDGCGLNKEPMGCKDTCDPVQGPMDTIGPNTHDVVVDPAYNNGHFTTNATTEDTCTVIKTAKYYIGHSSVGSCSELMAEKSGTIYPADDGSFNLDKLKEDLAGVYSFYRDGMNYICIQAQDNVGNWGNCACGYFETDTIPPDCPYDIYLDDELYPDEYLICGDNQWLNATVCDQESFIQGGEYFIDAEIPPVPEPWSGFWMNPLYNFTRGDGYHCSVIGAEVDVSELEDGTHYIKLRGKDTAENWGKIINCRGISFIKDTTPPVTNKELIPSEGKKVDCYGTEPDDANVAEKGTLTDGCYYVKQGTQIVLTAQDPDPQGTGEYAGNVIIHWKVWYKENPNDAWVLDKEGQSEPNEPVTISLDKDSYHLIEYWSEDACGWEEEHHYELDIVDTASPQGIKTIGEPKIACEEGEEC